MKYFLIGFMGCGKTTIAKKLSKKLNLKYIDLDKYIEKYEGNTIKKIFTSKGEEKFRKLEEKYLKKILNNNNNIIIATGGGTPIFNNLMKIMNNAGKTIYLECSSETLFSRLKDKIKERPLIDSFNQKELKIYIQRVLNKRKIFYKKATYIIDNNNENCLNEILSLLR